jgi:chromosome segregation and condensation protein ScpB
LYSNADAETFEAVYAVADQSVRVALLRIFGQHRNERDDLLQRIEELEADAHTRDLALSFGRWAGPVAVGIAAVIASLVKG